MYLLVSAQNGPSIRYNTRCGVPQNREHRFLGSGKMVSSRSAYSGADPKLVVAIDVGTTFSGASYTFLEPDKVPQIYDVAGYVSQQIGCQLYTNYLSMFQVQRTGR